MKIFKFRRLDSFSTDAGYGQIMSWCLFFLAAVFSYSSCRAQEVTVGVLLPLSGPAATYGEDLRRSLEFLIEQKKLPIHLYFEDDGCDPSKALGAVQGLLARSPKVILGPTCSGAGRATVPVAERAGVPMILLGPMASSLSGIGAHTVRIGILEKESAALMASSRKTSDKEVVIFAEQTEFGESLAKELTQLFSSDVAVSKIDFTPGQFVDEATVAKQLHRQVDKVFLCTQSENTTALGVKAIRAASGSLPIVTTVFAGSPSFRTLNVNPVDLFFSAFPTRQNSTNTALLRRLTTFESTKGKLTGNDFSFFVADAAAQLLELGNLQRNADEIVRAWKTASLQGPRGLITFDAKGDAQGYSLTLEKFSASAASQ